MNRSKYLIHLCAIMLLAGMGTACANYSGSSAKPRGQQVAPTEFRVRVGLYSRSGLDVARKVEANLIEEGYQAYLRRINSGTQGLYVGRDLDRSDADALKRRIDRFLDTKTLVVSM